MNAYIDVPARRRLPLLLATALSLAVGTLAGVGDLNAAPPAEPAALQDSAHPRPLVQIALLLDTSNSMDGLIEQAKSQLWRMVNEFNHAKRHGRAPVLQVALSAMPSKKA